MPTPPNRPGQRPAAARHHLDYAATSPLRPEARDAMIAALGAGNPNAQYAEGRAARRILEEARESIAADLGAEPVEVIFTSGGTEADNLGVRGLYLAGLSRVAREKHASPSDAAGPESSAGPYLPGPSGSLADGPAPASGTGIGARRTSGIAVTTPVEHDAVRKAVAHLEEHHGARVIEAPVDVAGRVLVDALADELAERFKNDAPPARAAANESGGRAAAAEHGGGAAVQRGHDSPPHLLWTCQWANNETGAIQPIADFIAAADRFGAPVHVDAVQAVGHVPVDFHATGAATLAASAHKFGGPRGIGALLSRRDVNVTAINAGGGQERGLRSGTPDVAAAAGMAAALRAAVGEMEAEARRVGKLRDRLLAGARAIDGIVVHTTEPALPGHVHVSVPGAEGDSLIMLLDAAGISAATGSACAAGVNRASHVLEAMGVPTDVARGALRLTLGWGSTGDDVDAVLAVLGDTVARARAAGMA